MSTSQKGTAESIRMVWAWQRQRQNKHHQQSSRNSSRRGRSTINAYWQMEYRLQGLQRPCHEMGCGNWHFL